MSTYHAVAAWLKAGRDNPHATKVPTNRTRAVKARNRRFGELVRAARAIRRVT